MRAILFYALGLFISTQAHAQDPTIVELNALKVVESSNGQNTEHALVLKGTNANTRAGGYWGVMPLTAQQAIKDNPKYFSAYHYLLSKKPDYITNLLNKDRKFDTLMATFLWKKLRRTMPREAAACAWFWGPNSYRCKNIQVAQSLQYVDKFNRALVVAARAH